MSIFDFFKKKQKQKKVKTKEKLINLDNNLDPQWKSIVIGGIGIPEKTESLLQEYISWTYANISAISEAVADVDFQLYQIKGDDVDEVLEHPILELLNRPNNSMTKREFIYLLQTFRLLTGESPIRIKRNGNEISELWPLNPLQLTPIIGKTNDGFEMIIRYDYIDQKNGEINKIELDPEEIIFIKNMNPMNMWRGYGVVEAGQLAIDTMHYSELFNQTFFKNSAVPYTILYTDQKLNQDTIDRLKNTWDSNYKGPQNAFKTAILEAGLKVEKLQQTSKDMDFIEQQKFLRDKLMAMFKTTKIALGITEDVNRANAEASEYVFAKNCVKPKMSQFVESFNEFLVPFFDDSNDVFLSFTDPVPKDRTAKIAEYAAGVDKWMTKNEIRDEEGLPPLEGGDEIWQSLGLTTMSNPTPNTSENQTEPKPTEEQGELEEKPEEEEEIKRYRILKPKTKKKLNPELKKYVIAIKNRNIKQKQAKKELKEKIKEILKSKIKTKPAVKYEPKYKDMKTQKDTDLYYKSIMENSNRFEKEMNSKIKWNYFQPQMEEIMDKLSKKGTKFILPKTKTIEKKIGNEFMWDKKKYVAVGFDLLLPLIKEILSIQGNEAMITVKPDFKYSLLNEARKYLNSTPKKVSKTITDTSYERIRKSLADGIKKGEGISKLKERVIDGYKALEIYQAEKIARTEVARATNFASVDAFKQSGVVEGKEWITAGDNRVCEFCEAMETEYNSQIGLDDSYFKEGDNIKGVNGGVLQASFGNIDGPPLHPNCFLHHSVKIYTDKGIKTINKIKPGDKVLTHNGRYKPVIRLLNKTDRYSGDAVKIRYKGRVFGETNSRNSVTITPEHPFLTQRGWVEAKNLLLSDKIFVIAKKCETCGNLMPFWKDKYCSMKCNTENTENIRKQGFKNKGKNNAMYGKTGKQHPQWKGGKIWWRGKEWDEIKKKIRKRDNFICQNCGMTEKEHIEKFDQPLQVHHINPYRYSKNNDFENLITICCVCHKRIEGTSNKKILENGGVEFMAIPILEIKKLKNFSGEKLYNFSVKDDESYIAEGIVTHNCRCVLNSVEKLEKGQKKIKKKKIKPKKKSKESNLLKEVEKELNEIRKQTSKPKKKTT